MVDIKNPAVQAEERLPDHAPAFEHVEWTKDPALRKLYIYSALGLLVASATTGYDG
jgi:hypothetical protein